MSPKNTEEKKILDAAAEVFAEKGFSGARVDEIAVKAGVNKAMLYYRVGDKEELYRRVVLRGQEGFQKAIMKAMAASSTAPETFSRMLAGVTENVAADRLIPSIILRELAGRARTLPKEGMDGVKGFMATVRSIVTMGVEEGSFRNIDPVVLQFLVIGGVFTLSLTGEMRKELNPGNPGPIDNKEISTAILDILAHGILKEGIEL
jgi:TetR/AcrR family transcriptional regulator